MGEGVCRSLGRRGPLVDGTSGQLRFFQAISPHKQRPYAGVAMAESDPEPAGKLECKETSTVRQIGSPAMACSPRLESGSDARFGARGWPPPVQKKRFPPHEALVDVPPRPIEARQRLRRNDLLPGGPRPLTGTRSDPQFGPDPVGIRR